MKRWVAVMLAVGLLGTGLVVATPPAEANGRYEPAPLYVAPGPVCSIFWVNGHWHGPWWIPGHWKKVCRHPSVRHVVPRFPLGGPEWDPRIVGGLSGPRP